jgi:hypothetical protein
MRRPSSATLCPWSVWSGAARHRGRVASLYVSIGPWGNGSPTDSGVSATECCADQRKRCSASSERGRVSRGSVKRVSRPPRPAQYESGLAHVAPCRHRPLSCRFSRSYADRRVAPCRLRSLRIASSVSTACPVEDSEFGTSRQQGVARELLLVKSSSRPGRSLAYAGSRQEGADVNEAGGSSVPEPIPQAAPGGFAAAEPLPDLIRRIVREELRPIHV